MGTRAQSAFEFDGIDDYILYDPHPATESFEEEIPWTVEVIFKTDQLKNQVLLSQNSDLPTGFPYTLGIDDNGYLYTTFAGVEYSAEEQLLETNECYHVSVVYSDMIDFYLNGNLISSLQRQSALPDVTIDAPFYIGQFFPDRHTTFSGVMEEVRIFADERSSFEISSFLFTDLTLQNDNRLVCFDFKTLLNDKTYGAFNNHSEGLLGGGDAVSFPAWTEQQCISPPTETVAPWCATTITNCSQAGLSPGQLLCNGNFEQFCSALYVAHPGWQGNFPSWFKPHHAFIKASVFPNPSRSDVTNWTAKPYPNTYCSPDFYVRDGLGSNVGFAPYWKNTITTGQITIVRNWILDPPTNTWNGLGNAVTGLYGEQSQSSSNGQEGIVTTINAPLQANTDYQFSGWFYKTETVGGTQTNGNGILELSFSNGTTTYTAGTLSIPSWQNVSGNSNWFFGTITFNTGSTIPSNLTEFTITNTGNGADDYIFLDDLSLRSVNPQFFPQYINTGTGNDHHHRRVKVDANDNVYVLVNVEEIPNSSTGSLGLPSHTTFNVSNERSSLIVKYDSDGQYLWHKKYPHMQLTDFDFDVNGDIVAVGRPEDIIGTTTWGNINYTGGNLTSTSNCPGGGSMSITAHETNQLLILRASANNGNPSFTMAKGGTGQEEAYGVHVDGSTAYILVNITATGLCGNSVNTGLLWSGTNLNAPALLRFNLLNNSEEDEVSLYTPNEPKMLKGDGNLLYVLREDKNLDRVTVTSATNSTVSSTTISSDPTYLQPSFDGNSLFVAYKNPGKVEVRSAANLSLTNSFTTTKLPLSIASGAAGDYVLYRQDASGTTAGKVLGVEKLDLSNFGTPIWSKESSGHNGSMLSDYQTFPYKVSSDLAAYQSSTNEIAIIGSFETTAAPWMVSFDANTLSSSQVGVGNCIVLRLVDQDTIAFFKRDAGNTSPQDEITEAADSNSLVLNDINIFPNPSSGIINIESALDISDVRIFNMSGLLVLEKHFTGQEHLELNLKNVSSGMYIIEVATTQQKVRKRIIIE